MSDRNSKSDPMQDAQFAMVERRRRRAGKVRQEHIDMAHGGGGKANYSKADIAYTKALLESPAVKAWSADAVKETEFVAEDEPYATRPA